MKFWILDLGYLESDFNMILALATCGTRSNPHVENKWIKVPCIGVLIDTGDEYILYDTGPHPDAMIGYWSDMMQEISPAYISEEQRLENQLALCGVKPVDIDTVVLSHLHMDHAGGLRLFPHANVYVPRKDYMNALVSVHQTPDRNKHLAYAVGDLMSPANYIMVDDYLELRPGIELFDLPGHVAGLLGMVVQLESGNYLFPSDCLYRHESYSNPPRLVGEPYDTMAWYHSIDRVRALEKKYNATMMYGHDWDYEQETLKMAPECYE